MNSSIRPRRWLLHRGLLLLTALYLGWGVLPAQLPNFDSLSAALDSLPDDSDKVNAYLNRFKQLMLANGEGAMDFTERAIALSEKIGYPKGEAEATRMQGAYYMINGAAELALEHYQKAYDMFQDQGNSRYMMRCNNNFATVYMQLELYDTALHFLTDLESFPLINREDSMVQATMKHNEGICLDMTGEHVRAMETFTSNLKTFERLGAKYEQSFTLNSMGEVATKLGHFEQAIGYLRAGEALKRSLDDPRGESRSLAMLANAYLKMGNLDSAMATGRRCLTLAERVDEPAIQLEGHKTLAEALANRGLTSEAYSHLRAYIALDDSLEKETNLAKVMGLQAAYGLKNKNDEIKQLQQDNALDQANLARQRLLILSLAGGIVLVLAVLVLLYRSAAARTRMHAAITAKNEELSAANGALQKSIVEREALVHMIIHDLKSPLHQTEALIQAMGELEGMPAMGLKMMDKVKVTNGRGIALIADLLALYQIQNQEQTTTESVDAAQLVTEIVASMEGYAQQKGITLQLQLPDKLPTIRSNPSMLTRVLENLISNALKFSKRSTTVRVLATVEQGELVFSVADEGPGISQEDQAHLFEKFRKLSARPTGGEHSNGLGLAIVKKLAEQLRGRVGVQSELGQGARFWVALPM